MKLKSLLLILLMMCCSLFVKAQAPSALPCMDDAQSKEFNFWIGEWDVYATGTQTLVGHSVVQQVSGGCAILENWTEQHSSNSGKSLNYVDRATNKWKQTWIGSERKGQQDFVNGEYTDSAMRFTFERMNAQGQKIIGRFIFYNLGPDKVRQFNETSADSGKTWKTAYDFTYIRKKG